MLSELIDPFIGVDGLGNTLCGPYLPFSIVRLGPDTLAPQKTNGYCSGDPIVHFSHTHVSGTGGSSRYGNIGVMPFAGKMRVGMDPAEKEHEMAEAGYYAVTLQPSGARVELTSTPRTGVHRYTFAEGTEANVLIDVGAVIQCYLRAPVKATGGSIGGFVEFISETEVVGRADCQGGWGHHFPYSIFFYARFDKVAKERCVANHEGPFLGVSANGPNCKAVLHFGKERVINLRVGISFVSVAKARASVDRETGGKDFGQIRAEARDTWERALSRIRVEGGTDGERALFYTSFARLLCMPGDLGVDDEFPSWHSGVRHFSDYYATWDSVRNANSLLGLIDSKLEVDLLNCLLDVADKIGWIPDAWIAGHSARIQGGSSVDILICEAALKGFEGIDYEKALRLMRKNNEVESPDPSLYGRHLKDYRDLGYVSTSVRADCVSRHLEYAYQDWCIGALADKIGQAEVARRYFESSRKIWNLWRDDLRSFAPRQPDGEWVNPFNPMKRVDCSNDPYFYEGTSWQWSFNTQHDFEGLVKRHGGAGAFVEHLDRFFDGGHYFSKETMLHVPYLYLYAGRPDKTAERVRECLTKFFSPTRNGLADNEDMGCQSAFYMCSAMGIYPLMGQDLYWLTTPLFERTELTIGQTGKTLTIEAPGAGAERLYISSATLNGLPLERAWLRHHEIIGGATIRFELSAQPSAWATNELPPSPKLQKVLGHAGKAGGSRL